MKLADTVEEDKREIYAYLEKRRNTTTGGNASTHLVTTTRLDPLVYLMFGAYNAKVTSRGLECDEWLPIVGDVDTLDSTERLKTYMDKCFLRVYEGIVASRRRKRDNIRFVPREQEDEGDYDEFDDKDYTLSSQEIKDLDWMTQNLVDIVSRANQERTESVAQSRASSRPGTPTMGTQSGWSTPNRFQSRPSTPSGLSRQPYLPF
jgi:small subunit ribosomal protein S24e